MTRDEVISIIKTEIMDLIEGYGHPCLAKIAMHEILSEFAWADYEKFKDDEIERKRDLVENNNRPMDVQIVYNINPRPL